MKKWRTLEEIDALVTGLTQRSRTLNLKRYTIVIAVFKYTGRCTERLMKGSEARLA